MRAGFADSRHIRRSRLKTDFHSRSEPLRAPFERCESGSQPEYVTQVLVIPKSRLGGDGGKFKICGFEEGFGPPKAMDQDIVLDRPSHFFGVKILEYSHGD